jgi:F-type H+-transporting ATPase subunit b
VRILFATSRLPVVSIILIGGLHLMAGSCWAGEGGSTWRSTFDEVMLWLNFGILVFLIVKYGRAPLIGFLRGEAQRTAEDIERVEESKRRTDEKVQEMISAAENRREQLHSLKERLIREGERKRSEIIESARSESGIMLEQTRVRIHHQIVEARERLKAELIDRAVEAALERLPGVVTADDQKKLVETFIKEA